LRIFKARFGPDHPDTKKTNRGLSFLPGARKQKKQRSKNRP